MPPILWGMPQAPPNAGNIQRHSPERTSSASLWQWRERGRDPTAFRGQAATVDLRVATTAGRTEAAAETAGEITDVSPAAPDIGLLLIAMSETEPPILSVDMIHSKLNEDNRIVSTTAGITSTALDAVSTDGIGKC